MRRHAPGCIFRRLNIVAITARQFIDEFAAKSNATHHQDSRSPSTCSRAPASESAATQVNTCPACDSLPARILSMCEHTYTAGWGPQAAARPPAWRLRQRQPGPMQPMAVEV